jgi:putative membrane protein
MSSSPSQTFFSEEAKAKIVEAVREVESKSSAEIVVSLRARSDDYREIDFGAGLFLALITLVVLIYHPAELDENLMPVETLAAFVFGSIVVNKVSALKRAFTSRKRKRDRTLAAARANFVEAGVSRTRDRSGILVFVSELERAVCVVPDIGIEADKLGDGWKANLDALESSAANLDLGAFVSALTALGPVLGAKYPRREDDTNELPDAPHMEPTR